MANELNKWISNSITDSPNTWLFLLFRIDGRITTGHNLRQSVWSQGSISVIEKVKTSLSWTITECRRKYDRRMKFAGYFGGEPEFGVFPHIHAALELPTHTSQDTITEYLDNLWNIKLTKSLNQSVNSNVSSEILHDAKSCTSYCARYEGNTFSFGDEKVIVNNSFFF